MSEFIARVYHAYKDAERHYAATGEITSQPVFCEDCTHFTYRLDRELDDKPGYFTHKWGCWRDTTISAVEASARYKALNKQNNCGLYKRKWWKFGRPK